MDSPLASQLKEPEEVFISYLFPKPMETSGIGRFFVQPGTLTTMQELREDFGFVLA